MIDPMPVRVRAHVMYMALYMRANNALYSVMYAPVHGADRVHAATQGISSKSHGGQYLYDLTPKTTVRQEANLVPHSPAIVPQSKCLTAGLTGVTAQGLRSLVPQCPAITAKLYAYAGARTYAHTHARA